ncbi:MAG: aminotransferase class V-fold PLP-dependent enzyme [Caulobacteraceae bacterium]|nr:MAG: aminotransferase class V-fold PLP-dependent enzyme [Caulobacteraceae bacterium]
MSDETSKRALSRRGLLGGAGLALASAGAAGIAQAQPPAGAEPPPDSDPDFGGAEHHPAPPPMEAPPKVVDWNWVRSQWALDWSWVNLSAMLFASHPRFVRNAIARHRDGLDANPVAYLEANNRPLQNAARRAAGLYFGADPEAIALVESTTSGIGLVYNGLRIGYGEEILTTTHDYYVTHESLRLLARRSGATVRRISLFDQAATASAAQIVGRLMAAITERTRVMALTWVHSSTGLKMPIAASLRGVNAAREPSKKVLLCVDGVHGFGVEDVTFDQLGADVLVAGCHKWLFGPRGSGVVFFRPDSLGRFEPTIPTFLAPNAYGPWLGDYDPGPTTGARMTPGGFKAFEHVWALNEAFAFHGMVGKAAIEARTHGLASRLKLALSQLPNVVVRTPMDPGMSAGIVSFDLPGLSADAVVRRLREGKVIGSAAPYATRHVRLTPSFRNTEADVDFAVQILANIRR